MNTIVTANNDITNIDTSIINKGGEVGKSGASRAIDSGNILLLLLSLSL